MFLFFLPGCGRDIFSLISTDMSLTISEIMDASPIVFNVSLVVLNSIFIEDLTRESVPPVPLWRQPELCLGVGWMELPIFFSDAIVLVKALKQCRRMGNAIKYLHRSVGLPNSFFLFLFFFFSFSFFLPLLSKTCRSLDLKQTK